MRGIVIELDNQPGLCRKTRQAIPAAIRRGLERNPEVAFRLLDTTTCCAMHEMKLIFRRLATST